MDIKYKYSEVEFKFEGSFPQTGIPPLSTQTYRSRWKCRPGGCPSRTRCSSSRPRCTPCTQTSSICLKGLYANFTKNENKPHRQLHGLILLSTCDIFSIFMTFQVQKLQRIWDCISICFFDEPAKNVVSYSSLIYWLIGQGPCDNLWQQKTTCCREIILHIICKVQTYYERLFLDFIYLWKMFPNKSSLEKKSRFATHLIYVILFSRHFPETDVDMVVYI